MNTYYNKKDQLRSAAIDWQNDFNNHNYYMSELMWYSNYFYKYGKRYGLLKEFKENGII